MTRLATIFAIIGILLAPSVASAVDVFVNGENVTGILNVSIVNARVRIDERGNVHVEAPGYTVRRVDVPAPARPGQAAPPTGSVPYGSQPPRSTVVTGGGSAPAPAAPATNLTRRYYLVTSQAAPGRAQFDLEVFVNGQSAGRSRNDGDALIDNITRFLRAGPNEIRVVAHKDLTGGRRSSAATDNHRVIIGEGTEQNGQVVLQVALVDFTVNAGQTDDQTATFQLTAR
ncbi:MAG: hypothetical protein HYY06_17085 [Deltaproteobacteria bacterium]|nr:hypothetical protein [Deltaproteobacteria bacterium]